MSQSSRPMIGPTNLFLLIRIGLWHDQHLLTLKHKQVSSCDRKHVYWLMDRGFDGSDEAASGCLRSHVSDLHDILLPRSREEREKLTDKPHRPSAGPRQSRQRSHTVLNRPSDPVRCRWWPCRPSMLGVADDATTGLMTDSTNPWASNNPALCQPEIVLDEQPMIVYYTAGMAEG